MCLFTSCLQLNGVCKTACSSWSESGETAPETGHKLMREFMVCELSLAAVSQDSCLKLDVGHIKYYNTFVGFAVLTSEMTWLSKDSLDNYFVFVFMALVHYHWDSFTKTQEYFICRKHTKSKITLKLSCVSFLRSRYFKNNWVRNLRDIYTKTF